LKGDLEKSGYIFDLQRFSLHDGPGTRSTVFFKGCPLDCLWCHNPESISPQLELGFDGRECVGCGRCFAACPTEALRPDSSRESGRRYDPQKCERCWECVDACPSGALEVQGREVTVKEVLAEVVPDRPFYERSGGGVTLSGGEPTLQFEFCLALLKALKEEGISAALDTSGFASWEKLSQLLPFLDLVLYDLKHTDSARHEELTGVGNERILENLKRVDGAGGPIEVRIPLIPTCNDSKDNLKASAKLLRELENLKRVRLLGYHRLGESKAWSFDRTRNAPEGVEPPTDRRMEGLVEFVRNEMERGDVEVSYR